MLNCLVIDDEQSAIDVLANYINRLPSLHLVTASLLPVEALDIVYTQKIDLIFVDIKMPELSGIDFVKLVKGRSKIIFTTAYSQYALEGYEYNVVDYLLKPIAFERFLQAVRKVQDMEQFPTKQLLPEQTYVLDGKVDDYIFIKSENRMQKVNFTDILYAEGLGNYITLHTIRGKFVTLLGIKDLEEHLPNDKFLRVHRSYIISLIKVDYVEGNQIALENEINIPLGETYRNQLWTALDQKIISGRK